MKKPTRKQQKQHGTMTTDVVKRSDYAQLEEGEQFYHHCQRHIVKDNFPFAGLLEAQAIGDSAEGLAQPVGLPLLVSYREAGQKCTGIRRGH